MTVTSSDIIIIKSLLQSKIVDIHTLHVNYHLSPAQLQLSISKFINAGIVCVDGIKVRLTQNGIDWICSNRKSLFLDAKRSFWKTRPVDTHNNEGTLESFEYFIAIKDILEESEERN